MINITYILSTSPGWSKAAFELIMNFLLLIFLVKDFSNRFFPLFFLPWAWNKLSKVANKQIENVGINPGSALISSN